MKDKGQIHYATSNGEAERHSVCLLRGGPENAGSELQ